ncbi:MAG TPA: UbiX family flavin prenyltransferase [Gammaproteobacteria bacterium]|nr:UbiX family flavin prenyltransferase [Gammaproteobacteria bacterium]
MVKSRLIVGISGASGIIYGIRLLELLQPLPIETHLVVSKTAEITRAAEVALTAKQLYALADVHYSVMDLGAAISSGSFKTQGMIIAPCSMRTLAEIASGVTSNLLTRAADVVLKERRRLVLMVRESPLHAGHLENMLKVTHMGGIIAPPVPAFYNQPQTLDDMVNHSVGRVLDLFDIDAGCVKRWH